METGFVVLNGKLEPINQTMAAEIAAEFGEGAFVSGELKLSTPKRIRSIAQNAAMYLWWRQIASAAVECGLDIRKLMSQRIDIPATKENIKVVVWVPVMETMTGKTSTAKLDTKEVSEIAMTIDRYLLSKNGINVPFPSMDSLANESQEQ